MYSGTFEKRTALPDHDRTRSSVLAQTELHEEERHSREEQHDEVRNEEHTWSPTQNIKTPIIVFYVSFIYNNSTDMIGNDDLDSNKHHTSTCQGMCAYR